MFIKSRLDKSQEWELSTYCVLSTDCVIYEPSTLHAEQMVNRITGCWLSFEFSWNYNSVLPAYRYAIASVEMDLAPKPSSSMSILMSHKYLSRMTSPGSTSSGASSGCGSLYFLGGGGGSKQREWCNSLSQIFTNTHKCMARISTGRRQPVPSPTELQARQALLCLYYF